MSSDKDQSASPDSHAHGDHVRESGADIDNATILTVGLAGAFLIAVSVLLAQAFYLSFERADTAKKYAPSLTLTDYRSQQAEKVSRYRWVNKDEGVVAVPIERAMTLISKRGLPEPPPAEDDEEATGEGGAAPDAGEGGSAAEPADGEAGAGGAQGTELDNDAEKPKKAPEGGTDSAPPAPAPSDGGEAG